MKRKQKINPDDLRVGMKVKLPIAGWWFGSNKKFVWYKGTIVKIGIVDGKVRSVITSLRPHKKYGHIGSMMSTGEQCEEFYKVK
jgi:hypothetical protein